MGNAAVANQISKHLAAARQDTKLIDRWGRPIVVGGQYEYHANLAHVFKVVSIEPVRDLRAPAGLREIKLVCETTMTIPNVSRIESLTLIALEEKVTDLNTLAGGEPLPPGDDSPPPPSDPPADEPPPPPGLVQLTDI